MANEKEVTFKASFNPFRQCVSIDGEGQAELKLTTSSQELAKVISVFAQFIEEEFEVHLKCLPGNKRGKDVPEQITT